jgi:hypothetical protein
MGMATFSRFKIIGCMVKAASCHAYIERTACHACSQFMAGCNTITLIKEAMIGKGSCVWFYHPGGLMMAGSMLMIALANEGVHDWHALSQCLLHHLCLVLLSFRVPCWRRCCNSNHDSRGQPDQNSVRTQAYAVRKVTL